MQITFLDIPVTPRGNKKSAGANIQSTGNILFNRSGIDALKLERGQFWQIGVANADKPPKQLFFAKSMVANTKTITVSSAGNYVYLNAHSVLKLLQIDFISFKYHLQLLEPNKAIPDVYGFELVKQGKRESKK